MNKLYSVHDHWTDINKKNDVDIESIDGVITGIKVNGEDFGGESWETLFDGNVTTEDEPSGTAAASKLNNVNITADTIKVTFINTEYICNRDIDYISFGAAFDAETGSFDFSEYPFAMMFNSEIGAWNLFTPSSGTYSLKIEEPSSGGESDFSTATVEFKNQTTTNLTIHCCNIVDNNIESEVKLTNTQSKTSTAVLYKGSQQVEIPFGVESVTATGDITVDDEEGVIIINGSGTVLFQP